MTEPTPAQRDAIEYDSGNLLIVACAGSGKTDTLARRVAWLVGKRHTPKDSIIAFTFTEHAANELKARIRLYLEKEVPQEPSLGDMYVGTIHSFCLRVLHELDPKYRNWEVMDEVRQAALISANFTRFDDSNRGLGLDRLRSLTKTKTYWETVRRFTATLGIIHQKGISAEQIQSEKVRDAVTRYESLARNSPNYFFDFDQIIGELVRRLRSNAVDLEGVQSRFKHLIIDEYQDIDDQQEALINLLSDGGSRASITAVGDDDQALYGFRGASVKNILTFENRYPNVGRRELRDNFRSTNAIVEIADHAIRRVGSRLEKEMVARRQDPSHRLVERFADPGDIQLRVFRSEEEEADWVVARIEELRGVLFEQKDGTMRALDYADMAVLLRSVRASGTIFAQKLREKNIPVVVSGTRGLFNNDEIRLVQAAFCLLARSDFALPGDEGRLRILNTAETREFIRQTIDRLRHRQMPTASAGRFLSWIGQKLEELDRRSLRKELRGPKAKRIYPQDIFQEMLQNLGSQDTEWPADVLFNLGAFSSLLTQFEAVHQWVTPANIKGLCLFLGNWAATNADEGGLDEVVRLNSVQVMTVHAAKGLEWPVVFVPRVASMNFPSSRRNQGPDTFLSQDLFDPKEYAGGDDGERRLWYVALTRCAKFLNISSIERARKRPTEYFMEVHHHCVSRDSIDPTPRLKGTPRPPDDAIMLPTTFSDLTYFWRCHFEYQLRSLMGFSPGVGEQYGYGRQLHNILAEIHTRARGGDIVTPAEVDELVDQRFHLRYTQKGPLEALKKAAKDALNRYASECRDVLSKTHAVEKPFEFIDKDSGALITGVVDLLEKINDADPNAQREIVGIVDFKAHRFKKKEDFDELRSRVERQLRLYASAVRYAFPYEPATATAHVISPKPPSLEQRAQGIQDRIPVDISEAQRRQALSDVRDAVLAIKQDIGSNHFERTGPKTKHCEKCDFRQFCPGYNEFRRRNHASPLPRTPEQEREAEIDSVIEEQRAGS
jgi:DNA helicase-2/ATP-dependent DNA helicase PcrA